MSVAKEKYQTVKDYAASQKVTEKTIYNWIDSGKISKDRIKKVLSVTLIKL